MKDIVEAIVKELNKKRSNSFIIKEELFHLEDGYRFEVYAQINKELDEIHTIELSIKFSDISKKDIAIDKLYNRVLIDLVEESLN